MDIMKDNHFKVRIQCMTYNQAPYIEDAMNGFCIQQTDFPFLAVVVDDASTDGEQDVIKNYLVEHFDNEALDLPTPDETDEYVRMFARHKENKNCYFLVMFLKYNHYSIKKAKLVSVADLIRPIPYIALCEGDDYWTDPRKLQRQVDFLEGHEDVCVCFHRVNVVVPNESKMIEDYHVIDVPGESSMIDLAKIGNYIPTNSAVYRNDRRVHADIKRFGTNPIGDYLLWMMCAQYGKIYKMSDNMAVYRYGVGSWQTKPKVFQYINILNLLNCLRMVVLDFQVIKVLDDRINDMTSQIINMEREDKEQLKKIKESPTYRLGCFIAKPMNWVRKILNK